MPIAPVGSDPLVARSHASAEHVYPAKCPLTHATLTINRNMLLFVRAYTCQTLKAVVVHPVVLP